MRVITGEAKGRRLLGPPSPKTRPMADKIKEAVFSALAALGVDAVRVLDLYAGTGAVGIEALSRGADWVDFVEANPAACAVIRQNLALTKLASRAEVHNGAVLGYLGRRHKPYDLVFVDPPYADPAILETLERLGASALVDSGTVVVLGHSPQFDVPEQVGNLVLIKDRRHGGSCFAILEIPGPGAEVVAQPDDQHHEEKGDDA